MRITRAEIQRRAEQYQKEYGFTGPIADGWNQVRGNLPLEETLGTKLPRAVAYGAYMALNDLLDD